MSVETEALHTVVERVKGTWPLWVSVAVGLFAVAEGVAQLVARRRRRRGE
jgi:hypothetical protein